MATDNTPPCWGVLDRGYWEDECDEKSRRGVWDWELVCLLDNRRNSSTVAPFSVLEINKRVFDLMLPLKNTLLFYWIYEEKKEEEIGNVWIFETFLFLRRSDSDAAAGFMDLTEQKGLRYEYKCPAGAPCQWPCGTRTHSGGTPRSDTTNLEGSSSLEKLPFTSMLFILFSNIP